MPKKYFVTRHGGAITWAAQGGARARKVSTEHFDVEVVEPGDVVMGTLPVHLAAEVNARGGHYWHLAMEIPPEWRGKELSADQMREFGARLEEFRVQSQGVRISDNPEVHHSGVDTTRVHLCIATGQVLANLLPLLVLPWQHAFIFTNTSMQPKAELLRDIVIDQLCSGSDNAHRSCAIIPLPESHDWAELQALAAQQAAEIAQLGSRVKVDFNATGGTKLMSMAFAEAFRSVGRVLYCNTAAGQIDVIDSLRQDPIALPADTLALGTYLRAQGIKVLRGQCAEGEWLDGVKARESLTVSLVVKSAALAFEKVAQHDISIELGTAERLQVEQCKASTLSGLFHDIGAMAAPKLKAGGVVVRPFRPHVCIRGGSLRWQAVFEALQSAGVIANLTFELEPARLSFDFTSSEAAAYLGGGYLEEYVMLALSSLDLPVTHYAGNVGITKAGKPDEEQNEMNEMDAAIVWKNRLLVLECKAGVQVTSHDSQSILDKLDRLKAHAGGALGRAWLITQRKLNRNKYSVVFDRCDMNGIHLLHGPEAMMKLARSLSKELGCEVKHDWPEKSQIIDAFKSLKES